jgi:FkbM family methyltransferase
MLPVHTRGKKFGFLPAFNGSSRTADKKRGTGVHTTPDGIVFSETDGSFRCITGIGEYLFDDIRVDDIVLDIGANAGAFCIRAARTSHRVIAVEPVTADMLSENIHRNGVEVRVIEGALGDGKPAVIRWDCRTARVPTYTLGELIGMAGGCDFLKCDCEGAEWFIRPEELSGVRRIEMELHQPPIGGTPDPALLAYICREYSFELVRTPCFGPLGQMGILHAWRR